MRFKTLYDRFFKESKGPRTTRRKPRFTRLLVLEQLEDRTLLSRMVKKLRRPFGSRKLEDWNQTDDAKSADRG